MSTPDGRGFPTSLEHLEPSEQWQRSGRLGKETGRVDLQCELALIGKILVRIPEFLPHRPRPIVRSGRRWRQSGRGSPPGRLDCRGLDRSRQLPRNDPYFGFAIWQDWKPCMRIDPGG